MKGLGVFFIPYFTFFYSSFLFRIFTQYSGGCCIPVRKYDADGVCFLVFVREFVLDHRWPFRVESLSMCWLSVMILRVMSNVPTRYIIFHNVIGDLNAYYLRRNFVFMQYNAPQHAILITRRLFENNDIIFFENQEIITSL